MMHRINLDRKVSDGPPKEVQSSHVCIESATMPKINSDSQNKASEGDQHPLCAFRPYMYNQWFFALMILDPFLHLSGNIAEMHAPLCTCSPLSAKGNSAYARRSVCPTRRGLTCLAHFCQNAFTDTLAGADCRSCPKAASPLHAL